MLKSRLLIASFILALVTFSVAMSTILPSNRHLRGKIVAAGSSWRLEPDWIWYRPFMSRQYTLVNVPKNLQHYGELIIGDFQVVEQLGGSWGTILTVRQAHDQ